MSGNASNYGPDVWCEFANTIAMTKRPAGSGGRYFCEFCGATDHSGLETPDVETPVQAAQAALTRAIESGHTDLLYAAQDALAEALADLECGGCEDAENAPHASDCLSSDLAVVETELCGSFLPTDGHVEESAFLPTDGKGRQTLPCHAWCLPGCTEFHYV
jgi:hypothetical protein